MTEQALDQHLDQLSEDELLEKEIKDKLRELAHTRWLLGHRQQELSEAQEALEETPQFAEVNDLVNEINTYNQTEANLKADIGVASIRLSELSGYKDRKPVSGVQVKDSTTVELLDEDEAKLWLAREAPDALSIKKSKFDSLMRTLKKDFVEIKEGYKTYIDSDLSNYLDENTTLHSSTTTEE